MSSSSKKKNTKKKTKQNEALNIKPGSGMMESLDSVSVQETLRLDAGKMPAFSALSPSSHAGGGQQATRPKQPQGQQGASCSSSAKQSDNRAVAASDKQQEIAQSSCIGQQEIAQPVSDAAPCRPASTVDEVTVDVHHLQLDTEDDLVKYKGTSVSSAADVKKSPSDKKSVAKEGPVRCVPSELMSSATTTRTIAVAAASDNVSVDGATKSKAQLRAERRKIQEAQRSAKAAAGGKQQGGQGGQKEQSVKQTNVVKTTEAQQTAAKKPSTATANTQVKKPDQTVGSGGKDAKVRVPDRIQVDDDKVVKRQTRKLDKQNVPRRSTNQRKVNLFKHLVQYERNVKLTHQLQFNSSVIHPSIIKLGIKYMEGIVCGSNARCIALLVALKKVIADYHTPPNTELSRDLEVHIRPYISFLSQCRPMSVSMGNAIKYLKHHITNTPSTHSDIKAKELLQSNIDDFIRRVGLAMQAISNDACRKIKNGDTILVYSCSTLLTKVLCDAHNQGTKFRVIVADGRPKLEGRQMLRRLVKNGISCSYILINSVSYVMKEVTKVLLGAHALLANGFVMSRVGSAQVALVAKSYNIPVLVCCETYKFCERVQTDSFVCNELGDPRDVMCVSGTTNQTMLDAWQKPDSVLNVLNLVYDVTPPDLVTMVITELGMIPCTSVPVVLRVQCAETQ